MLENVYIYNYTCWHVRHAYLSIVLSIVLYLGPIHFYSAVKGMSLSEAIPTTANYTVGVYTPKGYRQLQVNE